MEKSALFSGIPVAELGRVLEGISYEVRRYEKGESVFHLMEAATKTGIILEGRVEAQKSFPNGSQVNVSVRLPGDIIGPAAVFSKSRKYPCDMVALEPSTVLMFHRDALLHLMQSDMRILENLTTEIASATYMLQQRLELLSYNGIAQKAAFWLLMQARQSGKDHVRIPDSVSGWAMLMNVSRPSLHRELKRLESENIISYSPPIIRILNQ
ncbi:MAG: Crp/Fnr family transcriptional regulator, partial [Spirochaetales bacterium]|nr:Crp/Fnr family transcriptional regulator [Spirochaetales bacterium]